MTTSQDIHTSYRSTEAKFQGGAKEHYVTYDMEQKTRSGHALYHKVKRVYVAGEVIRWQAGSDLRKRTGKIVNGVRIEYRRARKAYSRRAYKMRRGGTEYPVMPGHIGQSELHVAQIVEVPAKARNIRFHTAADLPDVYKQALQNVR
jgi:hypothetical protein